MIPIRRKEIARYNLRGDVDITDFTAMGLVGLNVDATVRVPESNGSVFPAAEAVIAIAIEPCR